MRNFQHCAVATGIDTTRVMSVERDARRCQQVELHVDDDLSPDQQVEVEGQRVERHVDRAFDRVLDRDETEVDVPVASPCSTSGIDAIGTQFAQREVGLREQGLFGKGPDRPEEADAERGRATEVRTEAMTGQDSDVDEASLRDLLDDVRSGIVDPDEAVALLRRLPFADLGFARVDHHRAIRSGLPEAIYGPGKTPEQCVAIVAELLAGGARPVVLTRADDDQIAAVLAAHPGGRARRRDDRVEPAAPSTVPNGCSSITAGTSDLPVADECATILEAHGLAPDASPMPASPACTGCSSTWTSSAGPTSSWWSPAWRAHWRASSVASRPRPSSPSRRASATAPASKASPRCSRCSRRARPGVTVVGIDNGFGAACAALRLCTVHADLRDLHVRSLT